MLEAYAVKWLPPNGTTQHSIDHKYVVVEANSQQWIGYELGPTAGTELGVVKTAEEARQLCEDHETMLQSMRRRA